jgi:hypothetical protein
MPNRPTPNTFQRYRARDLDHEAERRELEQRIEAHVAVHARHAHVDHDLGVRTHLHRVRGDGEVGFRADARQVGVQQADGDAARIGERQRRRIEAWMEPARRQHEVGIVSPGHQQPEFAFQRQEHDARFEQRREEEQPLLVEFDGAGEVDLDDDQRRFFGRDRHFRHADDGDVAGDLDDDAQRDADQRGRAPAELGHGTNQEAIRVRREDHAQVADDARRIGDRIGGEHDALDRAAADSIHERLQAHRAVQAEDAAHAQQREAETQLDAGAEFRGDDDQQREAARTVGHARRDQADGLHGDDAGERQLHDAAVFLAVVVEE